MDRYIIPAILLAFVVAGCKPSQEAFDACNSDKMYSNNTGNYNKTFCVEIRDGKAYLYVPVDSQFIYDRDSEE